MKLKLLSIYAALFSISAPAWSGVLIHETFSYSDGLLANQGGWSIFGGTANPIKVVNGAVVLVQGEPNRQDVVVPFGARLGAGGKLFASYDLRVSSYSTPFYLTTFRGLDSSQMGKIFLIAPAAGGNFRLSVGNNSAGAPENLATEDLLFNTTYKIVVSYDYDTGLSELWVNPTSESSDKLTTIGDVSVARPLHQFILRQERETSTQTLDNLIIATSFAEALTAPGPQTPVQGPALEGYAVIYSADSVLFPEMGLPAIPVSDWADALPAPSGFSPVGGVTRNPSEARYAGWSTAFEDDRYVGFTVSAAPGVPLVLSSLDFTTRASSSFSAYKWGYRINEGHGFGSWTFSDTYTSATPGFTSGFKNWNFPDVITTGTIEFAFFATAASPSASLEPFQSTVVLRTPGLVPVPAAVPGALAKYTKITRYNIDISEASAVTYNWDNDTLFCIGDEGHELVEIARTGTRIGFMPFQSGISPRERRALDDSEGLAYLGNDRIIIGDERRNLAVDTAYVPGLLRTLADLQPTSYAFGPYDGNSGLEGVAFDPINNSLWGVKEATARLYEMTNFGLPTQAVAEPIHLRYLNRLGIKQFSDIYVLAQSAAFGNDHPRVQNILLLHRNRSQLFEINREGKVAGMVDLSFLGRETIEGLTMDDKGNIYFVAEGIGFSLDPEARPDSLFVLSEVKNLVTGTGPGRQRLVGTVEDDEIYGGQAADVLSGGGGMNTFVFKSLDGGVDTITDFKPAIDTLDLQMLLDSLGYAGVNPLADGTLRVLDTGKGALLQVYANGSYHALVFLQGLTAAQVAATNNFVF